MATGAKRRVTDKVENCPVKIAGQQIKVNLNMFPLGSYGIQIGMDWLEGHWSLENCKEKTISFLIEEGVRKEI